MKLERSGAPELESIPHTSPCEWGRWHKRKRAGDGGAAFTYPSIWDGERKGMGKRRRNITTQVKCFKVCADLGDELLAALVIGWQAHVWRIGLENGLKGRKTKV